VSADRQKLTMTFDTVSADRQKLTMTSSDRQKLTMTFDTVPAYHDVRQCKLKTA
jgi:hypothetical protein